MAKLTIIAKSAEAASIIQSFLAPALYNQVSKKNYMITASKPKAPLTTRRLRRMLGRINSLIAHVERTRRSKSKQVRIL